MDLRVIVLLAIIGLAHSKLLDLSCQQIKEFVDGHNSRRLLLAKGEVRGQPAASKMKSVIWDDELAEKAAHWASKNPTSHNPDRSLGSKKFSTGENLYWYSTTDGSYKLDPDSALNSWFEENKDFSFRLLKPSDFESSLQIGHYTQMAWSETTHIGCAVSQRDEGTWYKFTVVCNYGPNGNFLGELPYRTEGHGSGKLVCGAGDCSQPYGDQCKQ